MKTALKGENDKFSVMTLKPVSDLTCLVNRPKPPKLWAIAHENVPKTRKRQGFIYDSQTCVRSNMPCKSP